MGYHETLDEIQSRLSRIDADIAEQARQGRCSRRSVESLKNRRLLIRERLAEIASGEWP